MNKENFLALKRTNQLISISVRDFQLDFDYYYLQVKLHQQNTIFFSNKTKRTIIPKFDIQRKSKELYNLFLLPQTEPFELEVLNSKKESLNPPLKFNLELEKKNFLGEKLSTITINFYPFLILEFSNGFYTNEDCYNKDQQLKYEISLEEEIKEARAREISVLNKQLHQSMIHSQTVRAREDFLISRANTVINSNINNIKKKKNQKKPIVKEKKDDNIPVTPFYMWFQMASQANSVQPFPIAQYEEEEKYKVLMNMQQKNKIEELKFRTKELISEIGQVLEQHSILTEIIVEIQMIISTKREKNLGNGICILNQHQQASEQKKQESFTLERKLVEISPLVLSLKKERIIQLNNIFFNNSFTKVFDFNAIKETEWEKAKKETSRAYAMFMGNSTLLFNLISMMFKIPLRYSLFPLGSKSLCYINQRKNFFHLFPEPGKEDKYSKFIEGMNYQKENLKLIIYYFLQFFNFQSDNDYDNFLLDINRLDFSSLFKEFIRRISESKLLTQEEDIQIKDI